MKKPESKKTIRCAIYTRKSTDEGLEQEFNSLDAQREAAGDYIASQRHEGWVCLPEHFDDGGFSGGNLERPALRSLMARIEAGEVDAVVVYKVDRLSRSLLDFTRIMEVLDKRGVSFVSVTQQFNTTNSMRRLTLNILLSFAQFEREIISERTRDKMSAARKKGKWIGGKPFLGYDIAPEGRSLIVNEVEAERVRASFQLYLEIQSLSLTVEELNRRGWTMKRWTTQKGREAGGAPFTKNGLNGLLTNPSYIGKVRFREQTYAAEFPGIVPEEIFERVRQCLRHNSRNCGTTRRNKHEALLRGILRCGHCDCAMTHTMAKRRGTKVYRYYVCNHAMKAGWGKCSSPSLPAAEIEAFVVQEISRIGSDPALQDEVIRQHEAQRQAERACALETKRKLEIEAKRIASNIQQAAAASDANTLAVLNQRETENQAALVRVGIELEDLEQAAIRSVELRQALEAFNETWDAQHLHDRMRLLNLLIERVAYDGESGEIAITFRPNGIRTLEPESTPA